MLRDRESIHDSSHCHHSSQGANRRRLRNRSVLRHRRTRDARRRLQTAFARGPRRPHETGQGKRNFPVRRLGMKTQDLKWKGGVTRLEIGDHNVFREGVTVHCATDDGNATVIGSHNLLLNHAHVAHDCVLGDHIIMSGFAGAGRARDRGRPRDVGRLRGGASVLPHRQTLDDWRLLKMRQDVPPFMIADGNPGGDADHQQDRPGTPRRVRGGAKRACAGLQNLFREGLTMTNALAKIENELPPLPEIQHLVQFIRASERGISK